MSSEVCDWSSDNTSYRRENEGLSKLPSPVKTSSSKLGSVGRASVQMETTVLIVTPITLNIWVRVIVEMKHRGVLSPSSHRLAAL